VKDKGILDSPLWLLWCFAVLNMRKTLTIKSVFYRLYDLYFKDISKPNVGCFFYLPSHYFPPVWAT